MMNRIWQRRLLGAFIFVFSSSALAAAQVATEFHFSRSSFVRSDQEYYQRDGVATSIDTLALGFDGELSTKKWSSQGKGKLIYSVQEDQLFAYIPDLSLNRSWQRGAVTIGRSRHKWSRFDNFWMRGLWEPRFAWNRLHPEPMGLAGFFWEAKSQKSSFLIFGSPLFIPELGPSFHLDNGRLWSNNPWFPASRSSIHFQGVQTPLHYRLEMPTTNEVIFQPSLAVQASWRGALAESRISLASKPVNQLFFATEVSINLAENRADAVIHPRVLRHNVGSIEFEKQLLSKWQVHSGLTYEQVNVAATPSTWVAQGAQPAWLTDVAVERQIPVRGRTAGIYMAYMNLWGGDGPDSGEFASEQSFFARRYDYNQALRLGIKNWLVLVMGQEFETASSVTYDLAQAGMTFSAEVKMALQNGMKLIASADFLGVFHKNARVGDGFIGRYRTNDQVELGVSYAF